MHILGWPAFSNAKSNLYQTRLYQEMLKEHSVTDASMSFGGLARCWAQRVDILHIHWIERPFWGRTTSRIVMRVVLTILTVLSVKARGGKIVWTAHDPVPHEMADNIRLNTGVFRPLWAVYRYILMKCIDGVLFLSASHVPLVAGQYPRLAHVPHAVTPHPHYRGVYPNAISRQEARNLLALPDKSTVFAFVGKLRPYKNVEGLLTAFNAFAEKSARLVVAGEVDTATYAATLRELAAVNDRVALVEAFVPDERLQDYLNAADVVVLPFKDVTNSGSLLLALSFDRPAVVPDVPVFREIRDMVGADWVYLFSDKLSGETLAAVVEWLRDTPRDASPPMGELDWSTTAAKTVSFYRKLRGEPMPVGGG
jgi:glycosyltransferase involved in cell wall biosynthesis